MGKILTIGIPYLENVENKTRLYSDLYVDGEKVYSLWYEVDQKYGKYFCYEVSDTFLVTLITYAMKNNLNVECLQPVTARLYYQLTEYIIPTLSKRIEKFYEIKINCKLYDGKFESENAVGASLSGGVDSFYTLLKHTGRKEKEFNVNYLTFYNVGACGDLGGEIARKTYHSRINWIKKVAENLKLPMLCVDSNISEFLKEPHVEGHTYRTLAVPLAFQKLFSKYYFASGIPYWGFSFDAHDTAFYDLLNVQCLSTDSLTIYSTGGNASRLEKEAYISTFEAPQRFLNVCVAQGTACSKCEKCQRTILGLYILGQLEKFDNVFDVLYFKKHKSWYLSNAVFYKNTSLDWKEIYIELSKKGVIGIKEIIFGNIKRIISNIYNVACSSKRLKKIYHYIKNKKNSERPS